MAIADIQAKVTVDVVGGKIEGLDGFGNVYVLTLPVQYFTSGSQDDHEVLTQFQETLKGLLDAPQSESKGIVLPYVPDDHGSNMFDLKVYSKAPPVYITENNSYANKED